jgi:hypothetical protein
MYLGGVGGTLKSTVIKALIKFFEDWGEAHRFLVLAPTGAAAALLNGRTYHSVLGIRDNHADYYCWGIKNRRNIANVILDHQHIPHILRGAANEDGKPMPLLTTFHKI